MFCCCFAVASLLLLLLLLLLVQMLRPTFPLRIAVLGDPGQTFNTVTVVEHMQKSRPDVVLMAGDLSYADEYNTSGHVQPDSANEALSCEYAGFGMCFMGVFIV